MGSVVSLMESDELLTSGTDSGTACDDVHHIGEGKADCDGSIYMDVYSDNEEGYSIDKEDDMGSVDDWISELRGVHPHHWWGIGEGCAPGAIDEWGPEAEGDCDDDTDTETDLAVEYSRMLDGVL